MTVSLALRGARGVSAATAARVRTAAEARGYYPDPELTRLAHLMRTGRAPGFRSTLAFLNPFPERDRAEWEDYFGGLWRGAKARAELLGYRLEQHWLREPGLTLRRLSEILSARGIKGILLAPMPDGAALPALQWQRFAGVALTDSPVITNLTRVGPDNAGAMNLCLRRLSSLGYRRPGLIAPKPFDERTQYHHSGPFLRWLYEHKLENDLLVDTDVDALRLEDWIRRWRPDVVICNHPHPWAKRWEEAGVRVTPPPAFVSLAWSGRHRNYAGVDKRTEVIGAHGVDMLIAAMTQGRIGFQSDPLTLRVAAHWHDGASCPPAARRGSTLRRLLKTMSAP